MVIFPFFILKVSSRTFRTGARQLVVQDAALTICSVPSRISSLTPYTMVFIGPFPGALMRTFLAPAVMCFWASSNLV